MSVPVPRPGLLKEYEDYMAAVDAHNRMVMSEEMGCPQPYVDSLISPARHAPRCEHIRATGVRCLAPALRDRKLCYSHTRMAAAKKGGLQLPPLEDASGIALAAMQVVQQLLDGKIDRKTAAVSLLWHPNRGQHAPPQTLFRTANQHGAGSCRTAFG